MISEVMLEGEIQQIRDIMYHQSSILDFLSVVNGFREVCLVTIKTKISKRKFDKFLLEKYPNLRCIKSHWYRATFFVCTKNRYEEITELLEELHRKKQFRTGEGVIKLGRLFEYPSCCITTMFCNEIGYRYPLIPFMACSERCAEKWYEIYLDLARGFRFKMLEFHGEVLGKKDGRYRQIDLIEKVGFIFDRREVEFGNDELFVTDIFVKNLE